MKTLAPLLLAAFALVACSGPQAPGGASPREHQPVDSAAPDSQDPGDSALPEDTGSPACSSPG